MSYDFDNAGTTRLSVATPLAGTPMTAACWFKVKNDGQGNSLICFGNTSNQELFRLAAAMDVATDPIRFRATPTSGGNYETGGGTITTNTWHHAAMRAASEAQADRAVFLNGTKYTATTGGDKDFINATMLVVGAQLSSGTYGIDLDGKIAHVAIWDAAISDADITALAAGDSPMSLATQPVAYWPLTDDLVDLVSSLTLTNSGGATLDGADNPTVDDPPGAAIEGTLSTSIGTITLSATGVGPGSASEGVLSTSIGDITLAATGAITSLVLETDDEDADSYDTTTTEVIGDTIYLEGYYDGLGFGGWVNTNCRVSGGVDGATYNVVLDASSKQTPGAPSGNNNTTGSPWTPIVRFKVAGVWGAWSKLSSYSYSTNIASGSFVWATGATEARIAYKPVVTVAELDAFREEIYASPYAVEPPSSVAASSLPEGVHVRLTHGTGPNTVASGTVDLWCARVGTGPFVGMVVFAEHAQEDVGDLSAMQFIRWMLGASSEAADFRSRFSVYIYVHNLSGRKCGRTRYDQDVGTDEDPNRSWDDSNSEQTNALKDAIELDFPVASVDLSFMLAYHGQQDANVNTAAYDIYTTTEFTADQQFASRIATAIGSQVNQQDSTPPTSGTSKWFGHVTRSAPLGLTLEHADAATGYPDAATMHDAFAAATGEILVQLADEGYFGRLGALSTSIGAVTLAATGTLPVVGTLSASIGTIGISSAGKVAIAGTASASIGAISLSATGELALATGSGTLSQSIGEISLSAAGTLPIAGAVSASIGTIALASTSKVAIAGALSASVGAVTLSAAGVSTTSTNGALAATLGPVTLSSAARLAIAGGVNTSIGLITLSATNVAGVTSPTPPERRAAAIGESRRAAA